MNDLFPGIGKVIIRNEKLIFQEYPFVPSIVYSIKELLSKDITEVCLDTFPPSIKVQNEFIFITRELIIKFNTQFHNRSLKG